MINTRTFIILIFSGLLMLGIAINEIKSLEQPEITLELKTVFCVDFNQRRLINIEPGSYQVMVTIFDEFGKPKGC